MPQTDFLRELERSRLPYEEHEPETYFGGIEGRAEVELFAELAAGEVSGSVHHLAAQRVENEFVPVLQMLLPRGSAPVRASVLWRDVPIGAAPEFHARPWTSGATALRFTLLVDGEVVRSERVSPVDTAASRAEWVVDLAQQGNEGGSLDLELRVEGEASGVNRLAIWERPLLIYASVR